MLASMEAYKFKHVSGVDTLSMPAPGPRVCDNTFANELRDAATQRDQARELARLVRAQRKAGRRQSRASRRANR